MLARLATRRAKPNGAFHLLLPDLPSILEPLELNDLHGFGYSARQKAIEKLGSAKLKDLMTKSKGQLCEVIGKSSGETLYNALRGIDERKLESDKPRKSVSCDINVRPLSSCIEPVVKPQHSPVWHSFRK
jgi:DNA repair protein REV1